MNDDVVLVTCGPDEHGIVRFGRQLHMALAERGFAGLARHEPDPRKLLRIIDSLPSTTRVVHLQANDWLFSDSDQTAAQRITAFATTLRARGSTLVLTLHDLPHPQVSRELFLRRAQVYREILSQAAAVVVSSEHERLLMIEAAEAVRQHGHLPDPVATSPRITVIPLPVPSTGPGRHAVTAGPTPTPIATVGVLGFLYPGKGHREILEELAHFGTPLAVVAIGAPSRGHQDLLPELIDRSRVLGLAFSCTGFVPDVDLAGHLQSITVPVAAAPDVSASASINTWIGAGRRPLVMAGRYSRELAERMPGSVHLFEPGQLRASVGSMLAEPTSTHLPAAFRAHPDTDEVARQYLHWLGSVGVDEFGTDHAGH